MSVAAPRVATEGGPYKLRVPGRDGLVPRDREAHFFDHAVIGLGSLAFCREIIADEDRIRGVQAERLEAAEVQLAAAGNSQFARRVDEAEHGERLEAVARSQALVSLKRRSC